MYRGVTFALFYASRKTPFTHLKMRLSWNEKMSPAKWSNQAHGVGITMPTHSNLIS